MIRIVPAAAAHSRKSRMSAAWFAMSVWSTPCLSMRVNRARCASPRPAAASVAELASSASAMDRCCGVDAHAAEPARLIVVLRGTEGVGDARMVHVVDRGADHERERLQVVQARPSSSR